MQVHAALLGFAAVLATTTAAAVSSPGTRAQDAGNDPRAAAPQEANARQDAAGATDAATAAASSPSLVLVTIDTLRADHLSCYGYFRKTSPFIDSLAGESLLFERCHATIPHTTPSHASLFTSVLPLEHGITENSFTAPTDIQRARALVTTPQLRSYAQILQAHGWKTGGFVSAATAREVTGLRAGFEAWTEPPPDAERRAGAETLADAKEWLATVGGAPFFLWVHLFDVHHPYPKRLKYEDEFPDDEALRRRLAERGVPERIRGRSGAQSRPAVRNSKYDASIRLADDLIAELVAALRAAGAWDRTTFVLTSDHGEGLGEHGFLGHELTWSEQTHVPLIVRVPGRPAERLPQLLSVIDVLPTVIELTPGLPQEELRAQASGESALDESFDDASRPLFSMAPREQEFALTLARWKLVHRPGGTDALYDLESDPLELTDVKDASPKHARIAAALAAQLAASRELQAKRRVWLREGGEEPELSEEEERRQREQLEALGYLEGAADEVKAETPAKVRDDR